MVTWGVVPDAEGNVGDALHLATSPPRREPRTINNDSGHLTVVALGFTRPLISAAGPAG
jgi:hypothetical protein